MNKHLRENQYTCQYYREHHIKMYPKENPHIVPSVGNFFFDCVLLRITPKIPYWRKEYTMDVLSVARKFPRESFRDTYNCSLKFQPKNCASCK